MQRERQWTPWPQSVSLVLICSSDTGKSNRRTQIHRKWSLISSTAHSLLMAPPVLPSVWFGRRATGKWAHVFSESPYLSFSPGSRCFTGQGAVETVMSSCPSSCRHPACIWYAGTLQAIRFFVFLPEILLTRKMWLYKKAVPGCYSYPFPGKKKPECMF